MPVWHGQEQQYNIQWGVLQRTSATTNSFYQQNQVATTNVEKYYLLWEV